MDLQNEEMGRLQWVPFMVGKLYGDKGYIRHRSLNGFLINVLCALIAYCLLPNKLSLACWFFLWKIMVLSWFSLSKVHIFLPELISQLQLMLCNAPSSSDSFASQLPLL
jgi:hypothetical protein